MGSGFMPDAHAARERGLSLDINGEPPLPVVTIAGAGSQVSEGAAGMAALAPYPLRPRKSNKTSGSIPVQALKGYKGVGACRFLGKLKPRQYHPAKLCIVRGAESNGAKPGLGSQPSPAPRPSGFDGVVPL